MARFKTREVEVGTSISIMFKVVYFRQGGSAKSVICQALPRGRDGVPPSTHQKKKNLILCPPHFHHAVEKWQLLPGATKSRQSGRQYRGLLASLVYRRGQYPNRELTCSRVALLAPSVCRYCGSRDCDIVFGISKRRRGGAWSAAKEVGTTGGYFPLHP